MNADIASILQRVFYYENTAGITIEEIASETGKHPRQVYYFIEGERRPDIEWMRALSVYLMEKYHDERIAAWFLPQGCSVIPAGTRTNGRINDELLGIDVVQGQIITAAQKRDWQTVARLAEDIVRQGSVLKLEAQEKAA